MKCVACGIDSPDSDAETAVGADRLCPSCREPLKDAGDTNSDVAPNSSQDPSGQTETDPIQPKLTIKCHQCGIVMDQIIEANYHAGATEGILSCVGCGASLLHLLPSDCHSCGYFLKKAKGTVPGSSLPLCAKCHKPVTLKTEAEIAAEIHKSHEIGDLMSATVVKEDSSNVITKTVVLAGLAGVMVLAIAGYLAARPAVVKVPVPIVSTGEDPKLKDLQNSLSTAQAQLDTLRAQQALGNSQQLTQQIQQQQELLREAQSQEQTYVPNQSAYNPPPQSYAAPPSENSGNSAISSSEPPSQSERSAPAADQKSDADKYLEGGTAVSPKKGGK